ncbi:MAG: aldo/keto reductase [Chloroflexota bacterium]
MKTTTFGNSGQQVSEMCLGTMMFGDRCNEGESDRILGTAIDQGVTFIDTAASYCKGETEAILGRILGSRREQLFVGSKIKSKTPPADFAQSLDDSLTRLQTDYVDLYMIHWPHAQMQTMEMMESLNGLVESGKTRHVGCCNFPAWLFAHCNAIAQRNGWAQLVCNQIPYNVVERGVEVEVLPQAVADNVAITVYRPLLMGMLTGKYLPGQPLPEDSRGYTDKRVANWLEKFGDGFTKFNQFAAERNLHPAQLAIAWVRYSAGVTSPIVGVSSLNQLQATIDAFSVDLSDAEYDELTQMFDAEVREESGGNFSNLRRAMDLVAL